LDRLPENGDEVILEGYRFTVLEVDEQRITRLRAEHTVAAPEPEEGA
jgi:CBS domain containing-hemolysin-like protein